MYRSLIIMMIAVVVPAYVQADSADVKLLRQARSQIGIVAGELQLRMARDVQEKGASEALASCRLQVSGITDRLTLHSGWEIRRTSFKTRNPENAPDSWERKILNLFARRQAEGVDMQSFEFAQLVNFEGRRVFRYMQPIIVQESCLSCHGQQLAEPVAAKISGKYPDDKAAGYVAGELRGAFSLLKVLPGGPPAVLPAN